ncbi:replication/maintenance protein RepL [Salmonella enterica]|nr:replication/maintenance protein RepL [Salmonella enterica]ELJ4826111.1 replication/maintenance protein RepL [Salmonella enterica]
MSQLTRYKENPFLKDMVIPVKDRKIQISPLGKDNNILVNQSTGEIIGTHVTTYKKVDGEQFIKLFTANIGLTFDLTSSGIKVFTVMLWAVQNRAITKDQVDLELLTLEAFHEAHANDSKPLKLSESTYRRGLTELCKAQIIAKSVKLGRYFINPNFVFNGDRIAFTTLIERKREKPTSSNMELN